jgi:hypothetical protein
MPPLLPMLDFSFACRHGDGQLIRRGVSFSLECKEIKKSQSIQTGQCMLHRSPLELI